LSSNRHESDVINELISLLRELVTLTSPAVFLKGAQVESSHAAAIDDEFHSRCRLTPLLTISDGPITRWRALPPFLCKINLLKDLVWFWGISRIIDHNML
jgi:hypothetical protein